jgi:hypothetical protein
LWETQHLHNPNCYLSGGTAFSCIIPEHFIQTS